MARKRLIISSTNSTAMVTSFRRAGVALVVMQATYLLATFLTDLFTDHHPHSTFLAMIVIVVTLFALSIINIISRDNKIVSDYGKATAFAKLTLLVYYISVLVFSILATGKYSDAAIALLWTVLLATTGIVFGVRPFIFGSIAMASASVLNTIFLGYSINRLVALLVVLLLTIYTSVLFYHYHEAGLIDWRNYRNLKRRERIQNRRTKTLINSIENALISMSTDGIVQLYNPATLALLNTNIDINGQKIDKLFNLVDENGQAVSILDIVNNLTTTIERNDLRLVYSKTDQDTINLGLSIIPIKSKFNAKSKTDIDGYIIMASDITKRKSLEDERDEFISVVSHELRTPVAIAEGTISNMQFLLEKGGNPKELASTLESAHKQILYLSQMVNDLSTLSRAERGLHMEIDQIDLKPFIESLTHKYSNDAAERSLKIKLDVGPDGYIAAPIMVLEEIMQNLITNAIKYTDKGSITISAHSQRAHRDQITISVKDTGIGISKSDLKYIFKRFWRSEDFRRRKTTGNGLGLHVVKQLAQKLDIDVDVSSKLGKGSTFSITLPFTPKN